MTRGLLRRFSAAPSFARSAAGAGELAPASARSFQTSGRFRARAVALDSEAPSGIRPSFPGPNAVTAPNHLCRGFPLGERPAPHVVPLHPAAHLDDDALRPIAEYRFDGADDPAVARNANPLSHVKLPISAHAAGGKHFLPVAKLVPVVERRHRARDDTPKVRRAFGRSG